MPTGLPTLMKTTGSVAEWRCTDSEALVPTGTRSFAPSWIKGLTAFEVSATGPCDIEGEVSILDQANVAHQGGMPYEGTTAPV